MDRLKVNAPDGLSLVPVEATAVSVNDYAFTLYMGDLLPEGDGVNVRAAARMSPQSAKALSLLMNKVVREYEAGMGEIKLSSKLYHGLGLEEMI